MAKLNLVLLVIAIACALGIVTAQHQARKLFVALEKEQERSQQLDVEFHQLQLEVSTWATHARVERLAAGKLGMRTPSPARVQVILADKETQAQ
jgi:cell division protein FtsL